MWNTSCIAFLGFGGFECLDVPTPWKVQKEAAVHPWTLVQQSFDTQWKLFVMEISLLRCINTWLARQHVVKQPSTRSGFATTVCCRQREKVGSCSSTNEKEENALCFWRREAVYNNVTRYQTTPDSLAVGAVKNVYRRTRRGLISIYLMASENQKKSVETCSPLSIRRLVEQGKL